MAKIMYPSILAQPMRSSKTLSVKSQLLIKLGQTTKSKQFKNSSEQHEFFSPKTYLCKFRYTFLFWAVCNFDLRQSIPWILWKPYLLKYSPTYPFPQPTSKILHFNFLSSGQYLLTNSEQIFGGNPLLINYSWLILASSSNCSLRVSSENIVCDTVLLCWIP